MVSDFTYEWMITRKINYDKGNWISPINGENNSKGIVDEKF